MTTDTRSISEQWVHCVAVALQWYPFIPNVNKIIIYAKCKHVVETINYVNDIVKSSLEQHATKVNLTMDYA